MRAFVAIEISDAIREALAGLLAELRRHDAPVKWVAPENLHLTLKFLGNVPDESVPTAVAILDKCVDGVAPFRMEVKGAGAFPSPRRPRVLFVEAHHAPPAARDLAGRLNRQMTRVGVAKEDRPFRSHITIGRIRRPRPIGTLERAIEGLADRGFGVMTVDRITLMKSDLTPQGPIYTPIERVALAPADREGSRNSTTG